MPDQTLKKKKKNCMELEFMELEFHTYSYIFIALYWCFKWNSSSMNSSSMQIFFKFDRT